MVKGFGNAGIGKPLVLMAYVELLPTNQRDIGAKIVGCTVPIIIGALGAIPSDLPMYLSCLSLSGGHNEEVSSFEYGKEPEKILENLTFFFLCLCPVYISSYISLYQFFAVRIAIIIELYRVQDISVLRCISTGRCVSSVP